MTVLDIGCKAGGHTLAGPRGTRDRAVLRVAALGYTTEQIGRRLGLSRRSVEASTARLRAAYDAQNLAHAVARALACGDLVFGRRAAPRTTVGQRQILGLVAAGCSNAEIGAALGHKTQAVGSCLNRLTVAFGARCRSHLVVEAYRAGVLVPGADGRNLVLSGSGS